MKVYDGAQWIEASAAQQASLVTFEYVATAGQTAFSGADANGVTLSYTVGNVLVTLNGSRLRPGDEFTATNGTSIVLVTGASAGDELIVDALKTFDVANTYTQAQADARFVNVTGDTMTGPLTMGGDHQIIVNSTSATKPQIVLNSMGLNYSHISNKGSQNWAIGLTTNSDAMNGIDIIKWDSSGRVTMPYQPAFLARGLSNANTNGGTNSAGVLVFTSVTYTNGGHYNNSNGRFTAPVSGYYLFAINILFDDSATANNGGVVLQRNGNSQFNCYFGTFSGRYEMASATGVVYLNAGDYVDVNAGLAGIHVGPDTSFSGHLIG